MTNSVPPDTRALEALLTAAKNLGAEGIWQITGGSFSVYFTGADRNGEKTPKALDLGDSAGIIIIRLPDGAADRGISFTTLDPVPGYCRICGCSQENPCETLAGSCEWVDDTYALCSACADPDEALDDEDEEDYEQ